MHLNDERRAAIADMAQRYRAAAGQLQETIVLMLKARGMDDAAIAALLAEAKAKHRKRKPRRFGL